MMRILALLLALPVPGFAQVDQGAPNASFSPAFAGQTRAPALPATRVEVETVARGLENPWGIAPLPDGQFLVTERPGRMRIINVDGSLSSPISGLPRVDSRSQGGLLDVAVSPRFSTDRTVYWTYAKPIGRRTATAAAKGVLSADGQMTDVQDIFIQDPPSRHPIHFGSRILPMSDGTIWITTGEHSRPEDRVKAQDNSTTYGKVIRINTDGSAPADNPFVGRDGVDTIWSYGHRQNIGEGIAVQDGMEQPVYYWDPVIAPGGMMFYDGDYSPWQSDLLIGSLNPGALVRVKLSGGNVVGEERLLTDVGRIRDVEVLPDSSVLVLADSQGSVLRVTPLAE